MKKLKAIIRTAAVVFCFTFVAVLASPSTGVEIAEQIRSGLDSLFISDAAKDPIEYGSDSLTNVSSFHWLDPIAPSSGDPSKFDDSLLNYLKVEICSVGLSECTLVKTLTAQTSTSERLRIEKSGGWTYYIGNWDTQKVTLGNKTYRVRVFAADILLGEVELTPDVYKTFGRTWPMKFLIEKDPKLRVQIFASAGMNLWQIADDLRTELGICGDELRQLLLDNFPNATADQVAEVVNGVCQEVVLQPNTKIVDKDTRNALASFDTATGRMIFAGDTTLLRSLNINDVIVSRQTPAAPYGYLRKITFIRKSKGIYTLETVQAKFTEAIKVGTLQVSGPLEPGSSTNNAAQSKLSSPSTNSLGGTIDVGNQIPFTRHIDETIDLNGGDDEIGGSGTVRVMGDIEILAGYNIGAGIELCATPPFACADRVEAWMGFTHKSNLRVIGNFDGHLHKEFTYPIPMSPIFFMIGPIPVWIVPEVNVIVGLDGTAHVNFEFATEAQSTVKPYIKWTDDQGWQDLSAFAPLSNTFFDANFAGDAHFEGYAKLDASLLLYGAIGPSMDGSLGIIGDAQTGHKPFWTISGHVKAGIGLKSAITDLFDIDVHEDFLDETFPIKQAENLPPQCTWSSDTISAEIGQVKILGPRSGFEGYFECTDPEGDIPTYTAVSSNTSDGTNGVIPLSYAFQSSGPRTITVTARDSDGGSFSFPLKVDVHNSLPIVNVFAGTTAEAGVQFFMSAEAFDPDTNSFLPCSRIDWAAPPDTVTELNGGCGGVVTFSQSGTQTVTVTATDFYGGVGTKSITVNVAPKPANLPPVIDAASLEIFAHSAQGGGPCSSGNNFCLVPETTQYLAPPGYPPLSDEWGVPLTMSVNATDPEGGQVHYQWICQNQSGTQVVNATPIGDDVYQCTPPYVPGEVLQVYAIVSDDVLRPNNKTIPRTFFYRVRPN